MTLKLIPKLSGIETSPKRSDLKKATRVKVVELLSAFLLTSSQLSEKTCRTSVESFQVSSASCGTMVSVVQNSTGNCYQKQRLEERFVLEKFVFQP
jgi:hypothetical protein